MNGEYLIKPIAFIYNDLKTKFGVPRQSGLAPELISEIVFEPEYRVSEARREGFSPTVRPPRLGGNERLGVFATRSPFRPNSLALSCVKLEGIEKREGVGDVLIVSGADLMNGTPIYDIKPYLPYADSIPDAIGGFAPDGGKVLAVESDVELKMTETQKKSLFSVLSRDPRPQYHDDETRIYGMEFGDYEIKFKVENEKVIIVSAEKIKK